jgi:hypothetical protein
MLDVTHRLTTVLQRYVRDPAVPVALGSSLRYLGIDVPDLPMIVLDMEDACNVDIRFDADIADCATVADLAAHLAAKIAAPQPCPLARPKSTWLSTATARR